MFPRDWILETLAGLELWYWPIFFWEMLRIERYCARRRTAGDTDLIGIGVTRKGRIHIISRMKADTPDPLDWTALAPRAPWLGLAPGAGLPVAQTLTTLADLYAEAGHMLASVWAAPPEPRLEPG